MNLNCFLLFTVFFLTFGSSYSAYLKGSKLCRPWSCIAEKTGLVSDEELGARVSTLLTDESWKEIIAGVVETCTAKDKPRRYTDTCPGQAALHCIVDQMIEKCPQKHISKNDACSPVSSLAGFKYMFSQGRYENFGQNVKLEQRPIWYMKNYFSANCCNLPEIFDSTVLDECSFSSMLQYFHHEPQQKSKKVTPWHTVQTIMLPMIPRVKGEAANSDVDIFGCCDMSGFIKSSYVDECNFGLKWNDHDRLVIRNSTDTGTEVSITPTVHQRYYDLQIVPTTCENEECIFKNLQIVSKTGQVDLVAFSKLLDNFTRVYPEWTSAKARVVTECLTKPITTYEAECEINKVLACTFDVLSENCPLSKNGTDLCKHKGYDDTDNSICQISSSKLRPKRRRRLCDIPSLIKGLNISSCGYKYVHTFKYVERQVRLTKQMLRESSFKKLLHCEETMQPTKCLLDKMGVLSKYRFLDYFKMKDKIHSFTENNLEWHSLREALFSTFSSSQMYSSHCTSQRKLLNVLDTMLKTCPSSKRNSSPKCEKMFSQISQQPTSAVRYNPIARFNLFFPHIRQRYNSLYPFEHSRFPPTSSNSNLNISHGLTHFNTSFNESRARNNATSKTISIMPVYYPNIWQNTGRRLYYNVSTPLILLPVYKRTNPTTPMLPI